MHHLATLEMVMRLYSFLLWLSGLAAGNALCCWASHMTDLSLYSSGLAVVLAGASWIARSTDPFQS